MTAAARRGATTVADRAVRRIAEQAAREALAATGGGAVVSGSASVRGGRAAVAVVVTLPYEGAADARGAALQDHVAERTGRLTGLAVSRPRLRVGGLLSPEPSGPQPRPAPDGGHTAPEKTARTARRRGARPWSQRRAPVAVGAAVVLVAAAAALRDLAAVHLFHRPPAPWRVRAVDWLTAAHGVGTGSALVRAAAASAVAAGALLLLAALTPGRRGLLATAAPHADVRVLLTRSGASRLVRAAVAEVPGVVDARVRTGRRRVSVRARLAFGEGPAAERAVARAVAGALAGLGLDRTPRVRVRLRTAAGRRPPLPAPRSAGPAAPLPHPSPAPPGAPAGPGGPVRPTEPEESDRAASA
ncbi:DUF6286 domain-containing protein [Streptomyces subrutilus]|uniref:DUF6286 domain-containing protein n=1 Tax=Streptomyces subrutilus TaxID=36818 RepID=UPI0034151495